MSDGCLPPKARIETYKSPSKTLRLLGLLEYQQSKYPKALKQMFICLDYVILAISLMLILIC